MILLPRFLQDIELFDYAHYTGLSFREAWEMDPQQRLLLEVAEELLQKAGGHAIERTQALQEKVATFVGSMIYPSFEPTKSALSLTSHSPSILSNRLSHVFDLKGPSETVDAACASSLVALHDAKLALVNGEQLKGALVLGSSVICDLRSFLAAEGLQLLSKSKGVDRCKTFDTSADGIARGSVGNLSKMIGT